MRVCADRRSDKKKVWPSDAGVEAETEVDRKRDQLCAEVDDDKGPSSQVRGYFPYTTSPCACGSVDSRQTIAYVSSTAGQNTRLQPEYVVRGINKPPARTRQSAIVIFAVLLSGSGAYEPHALPPSRKRWSSFSPTPREMGHEAVSPKCLMCHKNIKLITVLAISTRSCSSSGIDVVTRCSLPLLYISFWNQRACEE